MKNQETGLGKYIYSEWLFPIKDYYCSIRKNEIVFEIVIPALCAVGCTLCYLHAGKIYNALGGLANLLAHGNLNFNRIYSYADYVASY